MYGKKAYYCDIATEHEVSEKSKLVAVVYGSTKIECEANAKLFISASDLLLRLQCTNEALRSMIDNGEIKPVEENITNRNLEAINKTK